MSFFYSYHYQWYLGSIQLLFNNPSIEKTLFEQKGRSSVRGLTIKYRLDATLVDLILVVYLLWSVISIM